MSNNEGDFRITMSDKKYQIGPGFFGLLGIAFIVLKLCSVIDWSWWVVTLPLWGGLALVLAIFLVVVFVALIVGIVQGIIEYKSK